MTVHLDGPGCRCPPRSDIRLNLWRKPHHLGLVRIADLDGDGRSDVYVVHRLERPSREESVTVCLNLHRSRFARE